MRGIVEINHFPDTLSATVVRNILSKVRSLSVRDFSGSRFFDFRYGRYVVTALCSWRRCMRLVVRLYHRDSCDIWFINPGDYSLLPSEAFELRL